MEKKSEVKPKASSGKNQSLKNLLQTALLSGWAIKKGPKAWVRDHKKWLSFVNHSLFWSADDSNNDITGKYKFLKEHITIERVGKTALKFKGSDYKDRVFDFADERKCKKWYARCQKSIDIRVKVGFQFDNQGTVVDRFECNLFFVDSKKAWKDPLLARVSIVTHADKGEIDVALLMDVYKKSKGKGKKIVDSKKRFLARTGLTPKNPNAWVLRGQDMDLAFTEQVFCVQMFNEKDRRLFQESFTKSWGNLDLYQPEGRSTSVDHDEKKLPERDNMSNVIVKEGQVHELVKQNEGIVEDAKPTQWACKICTFINEPNHLSCAMCSSKRSEKSPELVADEPNAVHKEAAKPIAQKPSPIPRSDKHNPNAGRSRKAIPEEKEVVESESDNGSLEELYEQKEGEDAKVEYPVNRRALSVYKGSVENEEELDWSSADDDSFEEEMTPDFQRRIIAQTVEALKNKGGQSSLSTLVEIANNLRLKDSRYRTIIASGRRYKTRGFFMHKEAVGAIEALGFVPVGSKNAVFAWDPEFSALTVEEIIEAVTNYRKAQARMSTKSNLRSEMSFMTVDTEEITAINNVFREEDDRIGHGLHVSSE